MKLKNQGFSVISTLVAAGVGLIIMTALTQQMVNQARTVRYLESKMEAMQLQGELKLVLEKDLSCDASFTLLTGLNVANVGSDEYTDITRAIDLPATPLRPLKAIKNSYQNNRYFTLTQIRLFKPALKLDGSPNSSSPYDFKVLFTVQENGGTGHVFNVEGPPLSLTVASSTVAIGVNACVPPDGAGGNCDGVELNGKCIPEGTQISCQTIQIAGIDTAQGYARINNKLVETRIVVTAYAPYGNSKTCDSGWALGTNGITCYDYSNSETGSVYATMTGLRVSASYSCSANWP